MDKKINHILIGCGIVGVVIILVGSYILYRTNPDLLLEVENTNERELPPAEEVSPVTFTANSYSGTVKSTNEEKITIEKEDGSTEEYLWSDIFSVYDNSVIDSMMPIKKQDLKKDTSVQVSITVNDKNEAQAVNIVRIN